MAETRDGVEFKEGMTLWMVDIDDDDSASVVALHDCRYSRYPGKFDSGRSLYWTISRCFAHEQNAVDSAVKTMTDAANRLIALRKERFGK